MAGGPFSVGDLVMLKSGGPLMTVEACQPYNAGGGFQAMTVWFAGDEVKRLTCHSLTLELAQDSEDNNA
ncbi:DUF2158 domain-containing protein [uncultured Sphingomonas sp.]|uniref:YodC family protein n=1 Tax=uncultured Sphingomonas sp. TaxID=158754 RepID=UPI00344DE28C